MGVDAVVYVQLEETISNEELAMLSSDIVEAFYSVEFTTNKEYGWSPLTRDTEGRNALQVFWALWFYGPGYERGDWPNISGVLDWLQGRFGEKATVLYGGDCGNIPEDLRQWTPEHKAEIWEHFIEHGHRPYFD